MTTYGIYSKRQNECNSPDKTLVVRNGKVFKNGRQVRFTSERTALIWAEAKCREFFVQPLR